MRKTIIAVVTATGFAGLGGAAYATTGTSSSCTKVYDHITKTDNGHGTPPEWADLVMRRTVTIDKDGHVTLTDNGALFTRVGAGTPNGTGGQITHRVGGHVHGTYHLTATGADGTFAHCSGDVALSSTEYVKSLFGEGVTVTGGDYTWTYTTCREKWTDSSANNDGQGAQAGNITGKRCHKPRPHPTPTDTGATSPSPSSSPTGEPSTPPGEAPAPTPVPGNLGVTG